jgi:SAM-dependent methyltransferase
LILDYLPSSLRHLLWNVRIFALRLKIRLNRLRSQEEVFRFTCNICGGISVSPLNLVKNREAPSCTSCGSNRRFRSIIYVLLKELTGRESKLVEIEEQKQLSGMGLSDANVYAAGLSKKFDYTNTYYHKEPQLDITSVKPDRHESVDFIISSDVFEHIPVPVETAFDNLYKTLKKNGLCVFSVPYKLDGTTEEHFPDLYEYHIESAHGKTILVNKTQEGQVQKFESLRFHGGPGATLEMRLFSLNDLIENMKNAGFTDIKIHLENVPEFGVLIEENTRSHIISMRKPE